MSTDPHKQLVRRRRLLALGFFVGAWLLTATVFKINYPNYSVGTSLGLGFMSATMIYSFGLVFYRMVNFDRNTGKTLFDRRAKRKPSDF